MSRRKDSHFGNRPPNPYHRDDPPNRNRGFARSMRSMFMGNSAEISVVIRTYDGEDYLEELLKSLEGQETSYEVEILAVDAGSKDRTPLILRSHGIQPHYVAPGRGYRQLALKHADGEVVVFLSQDSMPLNRKWLHALAAPLMDERAAVTHGRIIADANVPPYQRGLFNARPYISGKEPLWFTAPSEQQGGANFLPATNYALRRDVNEQVTDLDVDDSALLERMYEAGLPKAYLPEAAAIARSGEIPVAMLELASTSSPGVKGLVSAVALASARMVGDLYLLGEKGELPSGERGEAYAVAIALHATRIARLLHDKSKIVKRVSAAFSPLVKRALTQR